MTSSPLPAPQAPLTLTVPMRKSRKGAGNPFYGRKHTPEWIAAHRARVTKWTQDELHLLRAWYIGRKEQPLELSKLATRLGRTKGTVSRKAREFGLSNHRRKTGRKATTRRSVAKHATEADRRAAVGRASRERIAKNGHPRGALGMRHTPESRAKISASQLALAAAGTHPGQRPRSQETLRKMSVAMSKRLRSQTSVYSACKYGRREDLENQFFRSMWEANYARYLNFLRDRGTIRSWEYEAETFWFEKIRRGVRSYTPDFRIVDRDEVVYFVEVKGWMDPKSKTKLKRMKKYHPHVDLRLVDAPAYREISRQLAGAIPGWETDGRNRG